MHIIYYYVVLFNIPGDWSEFRIFFILYSSRARLTSETNDCFHNSDVTLVFIGHLIIGSDSCL